MKARFRQAPCALVGCNLILHPDQECRHKLDDGEIFLSFPSLHREEVSHQVLTFSLRKAMKPRRRNEPLQKRSFENNYLLVKEGLLKAVRDELGIAIRPSSESKDVLVGAHET